MKIAVVDVGLYNDAETLFSAAGSCWHYFESAVAVMVVVLMNDLQ